jgi:hypothetical protein
MKKKKKKILKISIYLNPKQKKVAYLIDEICSSRLQGFRVNYMNMNVSRSVYKENICNTVMAKNPHMLPTNENVTPQHEHDKKIKPATPDRKQYTRPTLIWNNV